MRTCASRLDESTETEVRQQPLCSPLLLCRPGRIERRSVRPDSSIRRGQERGRHSWPGAEQKVGVGASGLAVHAPIAEYVWTSAAGLVRWLRLLSSKRSGPAVSRQLERGAVCGPRIIAPYGDRTRRRELSASMAGPAVRRSQPLLLRRRDRRQPARPSRLSGIERATAPLAPRLRRGQPRCTAHRWRSSPSSYSLRRDLGSRWQRPRGCPSLLRSRRTGRNRHQAARIAEDLREMTLHAKRTPETVSVNDKGDRI